MRKPKQSNKITKPFIRKNKREKSNKKNYKVRNWKEYNESLVQRGSIEFWIEKGIAEVQRKGDTIIIRKKRGGQKQYDDSVIEFCRLVGKVFHQRLRQTEGFVRSISTQAQLDLKVPDYSTLCRRGVCLQVQLPKQQKEKVIAILDSTGLKVYGEGEWKVRKHGYAKHRTWMKAHISIDADGEIRAVKLTDNSIDDAHAGKTLLAQQTTDKIEQVVGDGAYDKKDFYQNREKHPRDENLRMIRKTTRKRWKMDSGYHKRSKVETTMFRTKTIFGEKLYSRSIGNQRTEMMRMAKALNLMLYNGMPNSYCVT